MGPVSARPDPNAARKGGDPFIYKPRPKLDVADETLLQRMHQCGMHNMTHYQAAAVLGVSRDRLEDFWKLHPEYREAFEAGKHMRGAKIRILGDRHMALDPSTWRFVAKNELGMSDDPSKARADEAAAGLMHQQMDRGEIDKRILELHAKLGGFSRESQDIEEIQHADQAPAAARPDPGAAERRPKAAAPQAQGLPLLQRASQEGVAQPQAHESGPLKALKELMERLGALEASAVRKSPRKDGKPHTDRTKPVQAAVAPATNTGDEGDHAPPKLPGRIERKR